LAERAEIPETAADVVARSSKRMNAMVRHGTDRGDRGDPPDPSGPAGHSRISRAFRTGHRTLAPPLRRTRIMAAVVSGPRLV